MPLFKRFWAKVGVEGGGEREREEQEEVEAGKQIRKERSGIGIG